MSNFEERHTAWLDGTLSEAERRAFEAELRDPAAARREAAGWSALRADLRETLTPAAMPHGDFLNAQVLAAIGRETPAAVAPRRRVWFPIGRLALAGATLLAVAAILAAVVLPRDGGAPDDARFISQVIDARSSDPRLGATAFAAPGGRAAVLWISDAGFIPANEKIR